MQSTQSLDACTHRKLLPTWMVIWKRRRAGPLLLYASTCSFAVRPMFLAKFRKASLQQTETSDCRATHLGMRDALSNCGSQSSSHMHKGGVAMLSDTLVSASFLLLHLWALTLEPHPTLLYMLGAWVLR
jgi:hypothetical protein